MQSIKSETYNQMLHSLQECENLCRKDADFSAQFAVALKLFRDQFGNNLTSEVSNKEKLVLSNFKHRLRTLSSKTETGFFTKLLSRIKNIFKYGMVGLGRTTESVTLKIIGDPIQDPYANYVVGMRQEYDNKMSIKLCREAIRALDQFHSEVQSEEEFPISLNGARTKGVKNPLTEFTNPLPAESLLNGKFYTKVKGDELQSPKSLTPEVCLEEGKAFFSTIGRRDSQEDTHTMTNIVICGKKCSFNAIYDGHNGNEVSKYLQNNLHIQIQKNLEDLKEFEMEKFLNSIVSTFRKINIDINQNEVTSKAGATAICQIRIDDALYTFSTGDGCALILDKESGEIIPLNEFAKPDTEYFRKGIENLGGVLTKNGEQIQGIGEGTKLSPARAFGDNRILGITERPTITKYIVQPGQVAFLSCDGPFERLTRKTVGNKAIELLNAGKSLNDVGSELLERIFASGTSDNISLLFTNIN